MRPPQPAGRPAQIRPAWVQNTMDLTQLPGEVIRMEVLGKLVGIGKIDGSRDQVDRDPAGADKAGICWRGGPIDQPVGHMDAADSGAMAKVRAATSQPISI